MVYPSLNDEIDDYNEEIDSLASNICNVTLDA
jgi:hypothetical protein